MAHGVQVINSAHPPSPSAVNSRPTTVNLYCIRQWWMCRGQFISREFSTKLQTEVTLLLEITWISLKY